MPSLMHLVSLQQAAGVEAHCAEFLSRAVSRHPAWRHGWINPERGVHPYLRAPVERAVTGTLHAKYRWGLKLPSRPGVLRIWHCRRELAAAGADAVLIWNRTARTAFIVDAIGASRCIHWEHGGAWHGGRERERRAYLQSLPILIANSRASARVLELAWDVRAPIEVCLNALRPSLQSRGVAPKIYPAGRPFRLGVAARLMPVKGIAIVLHAVADLLARGSEVELLIAGAGVERARLEALAGQLGVAHACRFQGAIEGMRDFYASIDCLLHVPLTEAFGLVTIEAAAQGCAVITARVDGLPEAMGSSGVCLEPTLTLTQYAALGASTEGIPSYVFDPALDALVEPRAVDPARLADAVQALLDEPGRFEAASRRALARAEQASDFDAHVDKVMGIVTALAEQRRAS